LTYLLQQPNFKVHFKILKKAPQGAFLLTIILWLKYSIMEVSKITEVTIYESPDGGRTVYARRPGSTHRELHLRDPELDKELAELKNQEKWQEILALRSSNSEINHLLEQVEILYELSRKSNAN